MFPRPPSPPSLSSSASNSSPPRYPTLQSLPTSRDVIRCHPLGLRMSPLRRLSVQVLLRPLLYTLNPRSAVGRDPRRPPMPEFPAPACVASAPRAFRISAASIPHAPNEPAKALAKARSRHHTAESRTLSAAKRDSSWPGTPKPFEGIGVPTPNFGVGHPEDRQQTVLSTSQKFGSRNSNFWESFN
ncbi:hypothetical protein PGTUg99_018854 [Puccinia graminis f. sp. tritici]|uniref:Uncharacterized protein n=1 Tax=Puccinia graminis f. sp. tritici TaxID=56615 RepID=A0A5B0SJM3_PUCGR|nr:hypothetical protein PGTUg99_018854 [Puccinia graminis f. sp. tritici]